MDIWSAAHLLCFATRIYQTVERDHIRPDPYVKHALEHAERFVHLESLTASSNQSHVRGHACVTRLVVSATLDHAVQHLNTRSPMHPLGV